MLNRNPVSEITIPQPQQPPQPAPLVINIHGTMSRKERDKQLSLPIIQDPLDSMANEGDSKRLTKKDLAYRHFNLFRYRKLNMDEVAVARTDDDGPLILVKVLQDKSTKDWTPREISKLSKKERKKVYDAEVLVQDIASFNAGIKDRTKISTVKRKHILPIPRNYLESNQWLYRCRKGYRVYAMFPSTTVLRPATVLDNTNYCINDDNVCVVEFDGDVGKQ